MRQTVRYYFTKDGISGAHALNAVQNKLIIQVLLAEIKHPLIRIQKIRRIDNIPIVIAIKVVNTTDAIRFMVRTCRCNHIVCAKQKNCSKRQSSLALLVREYQPGCPQHFFVTHESQR